MSCPAALLLALSFPPCPQSPAPPGPTIGVDQKAQGCFHHEEQHRDWVLSGDTFTCDGRKLARDEMDALRRAIVGARREVPELLAEVGITKEAFLAHRAEAEDVAQDAMLRILEKLPEFDLTRPYRPWRTTLVLNRCRDRLRRSEARRGAEEKAALARTESVLPDPGDSATSPSSASNVVRSSCAYHAARNSHRQ